MRLVDQLHALLTDTRSRLVFTAGTITEVSAPLFEKTGKAGVMSLLNRLETLPHVWLRTVDLEERELVAAVKSLAAGAQYSAPSPFVPSYLDTLVNLDPLARAMYAGASVSQIVWDIAFGATHVPSVNRHAATFQNWVNVNRADVAATRGRAYVSQLQQAYTRKIRNLLQPYTTSAPMDFDRLGAHLWTQPDWCPALRLSFEVIQLFFRDHQTRSSTSDMNDFTRMLSVPHVDVFTADGAKRDYLRTLRQGKHSRLGGCSYWSSCRVSIGLDEVLQLLAATK